MSAFLSLHDEFRYQNLSSMFPVLTSLGWDTAFPAVVRGRFGQPPPECSPIPYTPPHSYTKPPQTSYHQPA